MTGCGAEPGAAERVRARGEALHPRAGSPLPPGSRHRPRDRRPDPGRRLPDPLGAVPAPGLRSARLDVRRGRAVGTNPHALDISDVWLSSYSGNTNEILWGAKFAARCPWITCVLRLSSYECGMDQPTFTPVQRIVEASGTLFFKFGDLDSTKPTGKRQDPGGDDRSLSPEALESDHRAEALLLEAPGPLLRGRWLRRERLRRPREAPGAPPLRPEQ